MHISDLIKRSQVQKGCDFPCATESNQGNTFLSKFQKINMKKLHSAPLVISTKNPNARWKPSNSCLCTYQRTAQGLESYVIPASKRLLKKKKKKSETSTFWKQILHLLCQSQERIKNGSYHHLWH